MAAAVHVALDALVPPSIPRVIPVAPFVSSETRMFSMDCAVRAQLVQAKSNALASNVPVISNILDGKSAKLEQPRQVNKKEVALEKSRLGNDVKPVQLSQAASKLSTFDVLIGGKFTKLEQRDHVLGRYIAFEVSISGKL